MVTGGEWWMAQRIYGTPGGGGHCQQGAKVRSYSTKQVHTKNACQFCSYRSKSGPDLEPRSVNAILHIVSYMASELDIASQRTNDVESHQTKHDIAFPT
jgi:hypothetical protein